MTVINQHRTQFLDQSYTHVEQLITETERTRLFQHALERLKAGSMALGDGRVPRAPVASNDPQMEALLGRLLPDIEEITGLSLYATYSYLRIYEKGDLLKRHQDRPSCEISVTLNLGYVADSPWPIWIQGPLGASAVELMPADGLIYRGIDCPHWRELFTGDLAIQVFLHYVDQNGPYAEWKFDRRKRLGTLPQQPPQITEQVASIIHSAGILQLASGTLVRLDGIGALVWKGVEARRPVAQIVDQVSRQLEKPRSVAEVEVSNLFLTFEEAGLLIA